MLTPPGAAAPLTIDGYEFSPDRKERADLHEHEEGVAQNTRGDYWVLNRDDAGAAEDREGRA